VAAFVENVRDFAQCVLHEVINKEMVTAVCRTLVLYPRSASLLAKRGENIVQQGYLVALLVKASNPLQVNNTSVR
jgi:hypothetical protein